LLGLCPYCSSLRYLSLLVFAFRGAGGPDACFCDGRGTLTSSEFEDFTRTGAATHWWQAREKSPARSNLRGLPCFRKAFGKCNSLLLSITIMITMPTSYVPPSYVLRPTSYVLCPTSYGLRPTPRIPHPTSLGPYVLTSLRPYVPTSYHVPPKASGEAASERGLAPAE